MWPFLIGPFFLIFYWKFFLLAILDWSFLSDFLLDLFLVAIFDWSFFLVVIFDWSFLSDFLLDLFPVAILDLVLYF